MKIKEKELLKIPYVSKFKYQYELKEDINLILNSIKIYSLKNNETIDNEILDFKIYYDEIGRKFIVPISFYPCDYFYLQAERIALCKKIEINANEYVDAIKHGGNYTITILDY